MSMYPRWTTPAGIAVYPRIVSPDTKFVADGEYSMSVRFEGATADEVEKRIKQFYVQLYEMKCKEEGKPKLKRADAPMGRDEQGRLLVKTKLKAKITSKKSGSMPPGHSKGRRHIGRHPGGVSSY